MSCELFFLVSIETDELTEDMPVLVAESDDPYRHLPLASTFHAVLTLMLLPALATDRSLLDEESIDSSSSTTAGCIVSISDWTGLAD